MSGAWIGAGTAIAGGLGYLGSKSAGEDAANASIESTRLATDEQRRQFDLTREDLLPFLEAATGQGGALEQFVQGIGQSPQAPTVGKFEFDPQAAMDNPALQFAREQGEQQLDRLAAKNRQLGSGNRLLDAVRFGQGLSSQFLPGEFNRQLSTYSTNTGADLQNYGLQEGRYSNRMNRLAGLIDVGRGTGSALGSLGSSSANNISNLLMNQGNTQAASILGAQSAQNQFLGDLVGAGSFYAASRPQAAPSTSNRFLQPVSSNVNLGLY